MQTFYRTMNKSRYFKDYTNNVPSSFLFVYIRQALIWSLDIFTPDLLLRADVHLYNLVRLTDEKICLSRLALISYRRWLLRLNDL